MLERIRHLVSTLYLQLDSPDILHTDTRPLHFQIKQRFSLKDDIYEVVAGCLEFNLEKYSKVLLEKYKALTRSPAVEKDENSEFHDFLHRMRKVQKLLAKATHLKEGSCALTDEQRDFLYEQGTTLAEELQKRTTNASSIIGGNDGIAVPSFYPLYDHKLIDALFDELVEKSKISLEFQLDLYMLLCRQMVLFVPAAKCADVVEDVMSTFDLDAVFRFKQGVYNIRGVFDTDFCKDCCGLIDEIAKMQAEGVVHFVSKEGDLPSRRVPEMDINITFGSAKDSRFFSKSISFTKIFNFVSIGMGFAGE